MNIFILNATINGKLLTEILLDKMAISGVIGLDDTGASKTNEYYDYTGLCERKSTQYIRLRSYGMTDATDRDLLESLDIDLIIVASWQRLIPEWLINRCHIGIIGAHGSHAGITMGRGRSPQNWALLMDEKQFVFSIFWIEAGTDNGAIIDTRRYGYTPTDTIMTSYIKLNLCKADMIIKNIQNGRIPSHAGDPQPIEGKYLPQRIREDGMIDWNRSSQQIYNMIRALTKPYPGAFTIYQGTEYIIWNATPIEIDEADIYSDYQAGTVLSILSGDILVKCGKGLLLISEYAASEPINEGMVFESTDFVYQINEIVKRHKKKYNTPLSDLILDLV